MTGREKLREREGEGHKERENEGERMKTDKYKWVAGDSRVEIGA